MTYKQIEAARETRLWLSQIVIPAAAVAVTAMTVPEVREPIKAKIDGMKKSVKQRFQKKEA